MPRPTIKSLTEEVEKLQLEISETEVQLRIERLAREIDNRARELEQREKKKDKWDILSSISTLISGVLIAAVGATATIIFNQRSLNIQDTNNRSRLRVEKVNTIAKLLPHLISTKARDRKYAYGAIRALGDEKFIVNFLVAVKDPAGSEILMKISTSENRANSRAATCTFLTINQRSTISNIIRLFEFGRIEHPHAWILLERGDLSYGIAWSRIRSGTLYELVAAYVANKTAKFRTALMPYVERLKRKDPSLAGDKDFRAALKQAGSDPVMRALQERQVETKYIDRTLAKTRELGLCFPLSIAVLHDSIIQGGLSINVKAVLKTRGRPKTTEEEKAWIATYVKERRKWLISHAHVVAISAKRADFFLRLIAMNDWFLQAAPKLVSEALKR